MSEIRKWLEGIGLGQYGGAFEANKIAINLLGQVDDQILKDIGISAAGDRLRIRNAIAKLATAPVPEVNLSAPAPMHETTAASAERRLPRRFAECNRRPLRGRAGVPSGTGGCQAAECEALRTARRHQPRPPLARSRQATRRACKTPRRCSISLGETDPHLCRNVRCGSGMAQHEPVAWIEALGRNG
jgi:hypothetical protein